MGQRSIEVGFGSEKKVFGYHQTDETVDQERKFSLQILMFERSEFAQ